MPEPIVTNPPKGDLFYTRRFLNKPGFDSTAAIYARLTGSGYAELKLSDCHREVVFDICTYESDRDNNDSLENSLFKLELMDRTLKGLRMAMLKHAKKNGYTTKENA